MAAGPPMLLTRNRRTCTRKKERIESFRTRAPLRERKWNSDRPHASTGSGQSTPYIPRHQQDAIHSFFDLLNAKPVKIAPCTTCCMQGSLLGDRIEYAHCSNEVPISVLFLHFLISFFFPQLVKWTLFCCRKLCRPGRHSGTLAFSPMLYELQDITQMEEMLCSLASLCFLMWISKGGPYKTRGNIITFSQDISNLCRTLPRLPEQLDVLLVKNLMQETLHHIRIFVFASRRFTSCSFF
jgi:hypothetical protein